MFSFELNACSSETSCLIIIFMFSKLMLYIISILVIIIFNFDVRQLFDLVNGILFVSDMFSSMTIFFIIIILKYSKVFNNHNDRTHILKGGKYVDFLLHNT